MYRALYLPEGLSNDKEKQEGKLECGCSPTIKGTSYSMETVNLTANGKKRIVVAFVVE